MNPTKGCGVITLLTDRTSQEVESVSSFNLEKEEFMDFIPLKSMGGNFGISKEGKVKNFKTGRILKSYIGTDCYEHIILHSKGKKYRKRVHRLMAEAFFHNAKYVDHIDNNKSNNNLSNLRPISNRENVEKGMEDAKNYHSNVGWFKPLPVIAINKKTGEKQEFSSLRQCEKITGIDRHRIKTFLRKERPNHTDYIFKIK